MYWGQGGKTPGIYRAGLDGSNRRRLTNQHVSHPNGMTLGTHSLSDLAAVVTLLTANNIVFK